MAGISQPIEYDFCRVIQAPTKYALTINLKTTKSLAAHCPPPPRLWRAPSVPAEACEAGC
jgi:hypothetical protein